MYLKRCAKVVEGHNKKITRQKKTLTKMTPRKDHKHNKSKDGHKRDIRRTQKWELKKWYVNGEASITHDILKQETSINYLNTPLMAMIYGRISERVNSDNSWLITSFQLLYGNSLSLWNSKSKTISKSMNYGPLIWIETLLWSNHFNKTWVWWARTDRPCQMETNLFVLTIFSSTYVAICLWSK